MAKTKFSAKKLDFNDDLDFDFEGLGGPERPDTDDRHPVVKAFATSGKEAKRFVTNGNNVEKFLKAALPQGYGEAYDLASEAKDELSGLYNTVSKDLEPVGTAARSLARKHLPKLDGKIPQSLAKKLKEFAGEERSGPSGTPAQNREKQLAGLLDEVFQTQAKERVKNREESDTRDKVRQGFEQIRHKDQVSQLNEIRKAVQGLDNYNNKVVYNYQRKTLELSYRQYWAMAELAQEQKISNQKIVQFLKDTVKNTGLPDFVKTRASEKFKELTRNRFLDSARDKFVGGTREYLRRFSSNIGEQLRIITSGASTAASMYNATAGMDGMDFGEEKKTPQQQIIEFLTGQAMEYGSEFAAEKANKHLGKNRDVRKMGLRAQYNARRAGELIDDHLNDYSKSWGLADPIKRFLAGAAPSKVGTSRIDTDNNARGMDPRPFSNSNSKSLNEIIPGLLSRIHREIKILRTGDESTELVTYDFTRNQFTTESAAGASIKKMFTGKASEEARRKVDALLDKIDPAGKLTEKQRSIARSNIMKRALTGGSMDASKVFMASQWGGGEDGRAIAGAFNKHLRSSGGVLSDTEGSLRRQINISEQFSGLTNSIADPRPLVQTLVNLGQREMLVRSGVLKDDNSIDREALARMLAGEDIGHAASEEAAGFGSYRPQVTSSSSVAQSLTSSIGDGNKAMLAALSKLQETSTSTLGALSGKDTSQIMRSMVEFQNRSNPEVVQARIKSIDETLKSIQELMSQGTGLQLSALDQLISAARSGSGQGGVEITSEAPAKRTFSSLWEHATTVGGEKLTDFTTGAKKLFNKYKDPVLARLDATADAVSAFNNSVANRFKSSFGDVFINGERYPRITASGLKAGIYFDKATGAVINSLEDIRGEVVDNHGNVVLGLEDLKSAFVGGAYNKALSEIATKIGSGLLRLKAMGQSFIPVGVRKVMQVANTAKQRFKALLPAYDVYLKTDMKKPILYANLMRYEKYWSKKSGKPITHPRDIDGEVTDEKGNIIIGEDEMKVGLVDINGAPIGSLGARLMGKFGNAARRGLAALSTVGGAALGALGQFAEKFQGFFKELFVPFADIVTHSRRSVELLENIYDLLDQRLPGGKVRGDADGDGIRDGSLEDIRRKREAKEAAKKEEKAAEQEAKSPGFMSKFLAGLGAIFAPGKKDKGYDEDDGDDDDDSLLSQAADAAEIYDAVSGDGESGKEREKRGTRERNRRARKLRKARAKGIRLPKTTGKPGIGRRLLGGLYKPGGVRALGSVAAGAGSIAGSFGKGSFNLARGIAQTRAARALGNTALTAAKWGMYNPFLVKGLGKGLGAVGKGAAALGRGAMAIAGSQGLRTAGALGLRAAGLVLSWPVSLALTAGYVGYKVYQHSKKVKLTLMSKIRLAQYGFLEDNEEWRDKIFALEDMFEPHATIAEDGNLIIDRKKIDLNDVADLMGISNTQSMNMFNRWYDSRFVPVFRRHLTELRKIKPDAKIAKVESVVPGKDKLRFIQATVSDMEQVHNNMAGISITFKKLQTDHSDVMQIIEDNKAALAKEAEKDGGEKAKAVGKDAVASTIASADKLAEAAVNDKGKYTVKDKDGNEVVAVDAKALAERIKSGDVTVEVAVRTPEELMHTQANRLDALTSIRMKAYGLTEMSADKVRTLGALENLVEDNLAGTPDDLKLKVESIKLMQDAGKFFGMSNTTGDQALQWKYWFNGRFLPVFLLYAGSLRRITKKEKLKEAMDALPIAKQLELARHISACKGLDSRGTRLPVWEIPNSPWPGYVLNSDPDSTAGNIETIRLLADKIVLGEVTTTKLDKQPKSLFPGNRQHSRSGSSARVDGVGTRATGDEFVTNTVGSQSDFKNPTTGGNPYADPSGGGAETLNASGNKMSFTSGSGGMMAEMPTSSGKGWAAMKNIIMEAARIVGVDAKSLAQFIAVESGFDPNAMPKVNPKTGKRASTAKGLGQFLDRTWDWMLSRHGRKYGIPAGTSALDPRANAIMTAQYMKENSEGLQKTLQRDVSVVDAYIAHFMGPGGARAFLSSNPKSLGADVNPAGAKSNPGIFYKDGRPLTVAQIYTNLKAKIEKRAGEHGVLAGDFAGGGKSTQTAQSSSGAAPAASAGSPTSSGGTTKSTTGMTSAPSVGGGSSSGSTGVAPAMSASAPNSYGTSTPVTSTQMPSVGSPRLAGTIVADKSVSAVRTATGPAMRVGNGEKYTLTLRREPSTDDGTYGILYFPDGTTLMTIELPWYENKPRISCIPPGTYTCVWQKSPKFGMTYEVTKVPGRSRVLFHAGNAAGNAEKGMKADSQGCILLGMGRAKKGSQKVITDSKSAVRTFEDKMGGQTFILSIISGEASTPEASQQRVAENLAAIQDSAPAPAVSTPKEPAMAQFQPKQPAVVNSGALPMVNTMPRAPMSMSFTPTAPEMARRDTNLSGESAKTDATLAVLEKSYTEHTKSNELLGKIYEVLSTKPEEGAIASMTKPPSNAVGKMRSTNNLSTPVSARRAL